MFSLGEQIRSHEIRRCAAVSNHQHFRRACGHIDRRTVQTLAYWRFASVTKALPGPNFVHFRHRFRTKRQRGNGLCAADVKHVLHTAQLRRIKDPHRQSAAVSSSTTFYSPQYAPESPALIPLRRAGRSRRGIYKPTEATGRVTCLATHAWLRFYIYRRQFCAVWKVSIFFTATAIACFSSSLRRSLAAAILISRHLQRGNRGFIKLRAVFTQASSPRVFTLSRISLTVR